MLHVHNLLTTINTGKKFFKIPKYLLQNLKKCVLGIICIVTRVKYKKILYYDIAPTSTVKLVFFPSLGVAPACDASHTSILSIRIAEVA